MSFSIFVIFSFSIFIAALLGLYRYKKVNPIYHPFILYTLLASLNEICSYIVVTRFGWSNNANNNLYTLFEAMLITWQLNNWNCFQNKKRVYFLLQFSFLFVWCFDWYLSGDLFTLFHRYRVFYAMVLVLLCLGSLNNIIFGGVRILYKSTRFLVCIGLVVLFTFKIITESFWLYGLKSSHAFLYKVYAGFGYINLIINLLFILAVLWIPKKPRYITCT